MKEFKNIRYGYKLFETRDGKTLLPLFIDKNAVFPVGEWVKAKNVAHHPSFAHRPGIHVSAKCPSAVWLMDATGNYKSRFKHGKRVWCLVAYNANNNYNEEVIRLPKKCFIEHPPLDGFYDFKESKGRDWVITSDIKVIKILTEDERQNILKEMNYNEEQAFEPYKTRFENRKKSIA